MTDGWRSRGYLPHLDVPGAVQSITFRLADSLPAEAIARAADLGGDDRAQDGEAERWLNAGRGSCALRDPRIAACVEETLLKFDADRYRLLAWCVMPDHVHVVAETVAGHALAGVVHSWKSCTAKVANRIRGATGRFWQPEYFNRYARDARHVGDMIAYVEANPVAAGLVDEAAQWRFSSAWRRARSA